jgi:TolA-binding protein
VQDEIYENAYKAYEQVASDWPASPRAGEALYRAGKVAEDRKDKPRARKYYQEVINRYPDQAKLATQGLARVR